jgi:hypothetical protein
VVAAVVAMVAQVILLVAHICKVAEAKVQVWEQDLVALPVALSLAE